MDIYVARQPIFDGQRRVVAYELLARTSTVNSFGDNDQNAASLQMVDTTLLGFGLDSLLGDRDGFFNASRQLLVNEHWNVLPPVGTVIEVLETVEPDDDVVAACAAAKNAGYRLALDDFVFRPGHEALLPYTDVIKIDFRTTTREQRTSLVAEYAPRGIKMLAEKVETYDDFHEAVDDGYELFQGYFFCRPEMMSGKDVIASKASLARLIAEVNRPDLDFDGLEDLIKRDVALSVRLLRYLRSAGFGWRHDVETIAQALRILGERATRKWASLVALTMIGDDKPAELLTESLMRAQFCEELAGPMGTPERRADLFLTGLLSTLDAMLDRPMAMLLDQMALGPDVRAALLGEENSLLHCLRVTTAYDRGDWAQVDEFTERTGVLPHDVAQAYQRSIEWVGAFAQAA
jgi:EAL and modified HD-GYP domain-containing signal transduction protein